MALNGPTSEIKEGPVREHYQLHVEAGPAHQLNVDPLHQPEGPRPTRRLDPEREVHPIGVLKRGAIATGQSQLARIGTRNGLDAEIP